MDYVHHVAFDVYGRRLATCSGDRFVRIWDLGSDGEWKLSGEWQAHRGSISQIKWAHPEFGTLLATCGSDHDAKIWEEDDSGKWAEKAKLTEARRAVSCCEFAPRHWGLKLATGSSDGSVRIYEAVDVMNLAQWPLQATIAAFPSAPLGVSCLSWCCGRFEPPTLVVGGSHLVHLYRYSDAARTWQSLLTLPCGTADVLDVAWAPNVGRRYHLIAAADSEKLRVYKLARSNNKIELESQKVLDTTKVWRCQWNVTGTVLASSGDGGMVQLWKSDFEGNWKCVSQVYGDLTPTMTG